MVYGAGGPPISVAVDPKQISRILLSESGHNALFTLEIKGKAPARVMLKDWTVDPLKGNLLHVDMVRIARDALLKVRVPIHTVGEPKGVKVQGGIFDFVLREVELECLPDDIPENITVDVSELTLGHNLRVSDLPIGPKVKVLTRWGEKTYVSESTPLMLFTGVGCWFGSISGHASSPRKAPR